MFIDESHSLLFLKMNNFTVIDPAETSIEMTRLGCVLRCHSNRLARLDYRHGGSFHDALVKLFVMMVLMTAVTTRLVP